MLASMPRPILPLSITPEQRATLRAVTNRPTAPHRDHRRASIVLHRADGLSQAETARRLGISRAAVIKWERRFRASGLDGLADAKGRGRKPSIRPEGARADRPRGNAPAAEPDALVGARHGRGDRRVQGDRATVVERQRHQAPCDADVQIVQRQALRAEVLVT